ncbi:MAG TPA: AprI/Inh family metalloprotease inhibitor [Rhizomicrobium sp.]|nr:AprI/Inh family metalloprotease inhibitor [Rhizomicrobium sp.]
MTKLTSLVLGAGLALTSIGFAYADGTTVAGAWTLTVGSYDAPCTLTLTPDASGTAGTIASGADCPTGLNAVATWKTAGNGVQLYAGSGDLIAWLKPKGDTYVGTRFSDGKKLALNRT